MTYWSNEQQNIFTFLPMNMKLNETKICQTTMNNYDDSLTNLSWLYDINILKRTIPINNLFQTNSSNNFYPNDIDNNQQLIIHDDDDLWKNYRNNPQAKPVYSYSQLILLAMKRSGYEKMTLQMIYEWITENFPYFKKMEPTWQNSIRHNLSLNKCFIKVPRTKKENGRGKGGFWKLSPEYQRQSTLNSNKRIRSTSKQIDIKCESSSTSIEQMPTSFLSPISSPDSLPMSTCYSNSQSINDFSSILTLSPSKTNFLSTKFDEMDILSLDSIPFDWDAYLSETPNDLDIQQFLFNKTEQDLFNDFNAALTDLTYSAESIATTETTGDDLNAFNCSNKFHDLFDDDEESSSSSSTTTTNQSLTVNGRGIKRPAWWLTDENKSSTKLPSLEMAFDLKYSSK